MDDSFGVVGFFVFGNTIKSHIRLDYRVLGLDYRPCKGYATYKLYFECRLKYNFDKYKLISDLIQLFNIEKKNS